LAKDATRSKPSAIWRDWMYSACRFTRNGYEEGSCVRLIAQINANKLVFKAFEAQRGLERLDVQRLPRSTVISTYA